MDPKLINFVKMNFFFHKNAKIESESKSKKKFPKNYKIHVVVNFLSQVIFLFLLFLGMLMYANEV